MGMPASGEQRYVVKVLDLTAGKLAGWAGDAAKRSTQLSNNVARAMKRRKYGTEVIAECRMYGVLSVMLDEQNLVRRQYVNAKSPRGWGPTGGLGG